MKGVRLTFEAYVSARGPALLRFAGVLSGDPHGAQDLVQAALLRAARHWRRVSATDHPDAYVRKIIVNAYVSGRRLRSAHELVVAELPDRPGTDFATALDSRDELRRLLARLGPRQRAVLVLRYYADLDDGAIAEVLGCTPSTVRSQAARALAALRNQLDAARLEDR